MSSLLDLLPTPAKIYFDSIVGGNRSDITEKDFTPEELQALRILVANSQQPGGVSYGDYGGDQPGIPGLLTPRGRLANTLGQFQYKKDPEGITVTDAYDFNPVYKDESALLQALTVLGTGGFSGGHLLGEYMMPPGKGRNVKIRLENP